MIEPWCVCCHRPLDGDAHGDFGDQCESCYEAEQNKEEDEKDEYE